MASWGSSPIAAPPDNDALPAVNDWAISALWDDGNAEVALYDATETIYGKTRHHEAVLITVKEDFNTDYQAKADWPYGDKPILTVLKTNLVEEIPTENYPYRGMTSVFAPREEPLSGYKVSYLLHEWCGNTYKELRQYDEPQGRRLVYHTYWDGQGSGERPLNPAEIDALSEEQLFLAMRTLDFAAGASWTLPILTPLRGSHLGTLAVRQGAISVGEPVEREVLGEKLRVWPATISFPDGRVMRFEVADNEARWLLSADFGDGRTYKLKSLERRQYWARKG